MGRGPRTKDIVRIKLLGANPDPEIEGLEELPGKRNYFLGRETRNWHTGIPHYARVRCREIYPGIDLVYYGNPRQLEYDFVVSPGADPKAIGLEVETGNSKFENRNLKPENDPGANWPVRIEPNGDLVITSGGGAEVRLRKPAVYQPAENHPAPGARGPLEQASGTGLREAFDTRSEGQNRKLIGARYTLRASKIQDRKSQDENFSVGFELGDYDPSKPLVIDPVLSYSGVVGGLGAESGNGIAVDSSGNSYVTGYTSSADFSTLDPLQPTNHGGYDAFVMKINAAGSALVYSTFLGGSGDDFGNAIALDSAGNAYVAGKTDSADFPTANALQPGLAGGNDAFVAKLDARGAALVYSTYLGGSGDDQGYAIAVDGSGNSYVAGKTNSSDFPTANSLQSALAGDYDAFVVKIDPSGTGLAFSTFLGGQGADAAYGLAVDSGANVYLTGVTGSADFPVAAALEGAAGGGTDAFVAKINSSGSALAYSTYLGGSGDDVGTAVAVDSSGNAYVAGETSSGNFPTANPLQPAYGGGASDAFVTKVNATGSALVYSTYLGGSGADLALGVALDSSGNAYLTGQTASTDFPAVSSFQPYAGGSDAFVVEVNAQGSALAYASYLGGSNYDVGTAIGVDSLGAAYVTGSTDSSDFPSAGFIPPGQLNGFEVFVSKIGNATLIFSATDLAFGGQLVGSSSSPQTLSLAASGTAPVSVGGISVSGDFAQTNDCGSALPAGGSCTINVTFAPTALGTRTGALTIMDNASAQPATISLTGTGTEPSVSITPATLNFGNQLVGISSSPQTVTESNSGTASLSISSVAIGADFAETNNCGSELTAGASCTYTISFNPTSAGTKDEALTLSDNAPGSPRAVSLTGAGVAPSASVAPSALNFGNLLIGGSSAAQTVTETNSGTAPLSVGSVTVGPDFSQTNNCQTQLAPGTSCAINVTFKPASAGAKNEALTVADNAPGSPRTVSLTGSGADFALAASPSSATIQAGRSAAYTLTVTPLGGFNQTVSLDCQGAPKAATCSLSPAAVTPDGADPATATVTVTTTANSLSRPGGSPIPLPNLPLGASWLACLLLFLWLLAGRTVSRRRALAGLAVVALGIMLGASCGGNGTMSSSPPAPSGTPVGTYSLTVTATATSGSVTLSRNVQLTLTVS